MKQDDILSFRTAGRAGPSTSVTPSPTLELVYATYYLHRHPPDAPETLDWARTAWSTAPEVAREAAALGTRSAGTGPGHLLFPLAVEFGHARDADPAAFLHELPTLAVRLRERWERRAAEEETGSDRASMVAWLRDPPDPDWAEGVARTLRALWEVVGPWWEGEGKPAAEEAARAVEGELQEHDDVVRALPAHHFAQFEALASRLRDAVARGTLLIVPLAFASGGGFHLETDDVDVLGFGLQVERSHERNERRVASAAAGAKVLADPTRLMLLSTITRFASMSMTVGDLAGQLGVTQPTVSGHLKQLREAGLIRIDRQGNRSYPSPETPAVKALLDELAAVLDPGRS